METAKEILTKYGIHLDSSIEIAQIRGNTFDGFKKYLITELLEEYANQSKWISVEDELPNDSQIVDCWHKIGYRVTNVPFFNNEKKNFKLAFTHWQPIPKPPQQ